MSIAAPTQTLPEALNELQRVAPDAPFLALGQTVFWDEPMKAGVALASREAGYERKLVAGVHDTDYFAKLPGAHGKEPRYEAVPHNDTSTRGLWSAAAEFSALFGSETVITRETLARAGLKIAKLVERRPAILDEATEAWGWRGIVYTGDDPPVTADVPLSDVLPALRETLQWAIRSSLESVSEAERVLSQEKADRLLALVDRLGSDGPETLAEFYRSLLPGIYELVTGQQVEFETTRTTELLRFNNETAELPRFELLDLFLNPRSSAAACTAYNEAIRSSEIYGLERFGTGAIPFDLAIPGHGRGTIRIGRHAVVIMTPEPQFISLRRPISSVRDLAAAVTAKFGPDCVVIGKAVTLIGMLAREFVFVFHEGASSYVKHSRTMHGLLRDAGYEMKLNPILRVRYKAWDALAHCHTWFRLPEPLQRPFGTEELCAPSFAGRWRGVAEEQEERLKKLAKLRRPVDLIQYLDTEISGSWKCLADEYRSLHDKLERVHVEVDSMKAERVELYKRLKELKRQRLQAEEAKGRHWRQRVFERSPSEEDLQERERLTLAVEDVVHQIESTKREIRDMLHQQKEYVSDPETLRIHERRRAIEFEAELKRLRLVRQAVIASRGLRNANFRPSAWWFPILCPDGGWFRQTISTAECYLEPLLP